MKKGKWVSVNQDLDTNSFVDILKVGAVFLLRSYRWCEINDVMKDLSVKTINYQDGEIIMKHSTDELNKQK